MWKVLEAFDGLGSAAKSAVPMLTNLLDSKRPIEGTPAAVAWSSIEPTNPAPISRLAQKLETGDSSDRFWAAWALGKSGPLTAD